MTQVASASKPHTRDLLLDTAEHLIQTRGYNGFSYNDVAERVGIRKASIHFHFPSKTDLGAAVIRRYAERFSTGLDSEIARPDATVAELYDFYCQPYLAFAATPDMVCLSGALAGEMPSLPPDMQAEVEAFFLAHQAWLARIFARGGLPSPEATARLVFSAMQGALLVKRATGDLTQLSDVIAMVKARFLIVP